MSELTREKLLAGIKAMETEPIFPEKAFYDPRIWTYHQARHDGNKKRRASKI